MRQISHFASLFALSFLAPLAFAAGCGNTVLASTTSGGSGGQGPSGGSGGQAPSGSGGSSASVDGAPTCASAEDRIEVALSGKDSTSKVLIGGVSVAQDGFHMEIGKYGELYIRTADGTATDVPHPVTALLRMPEDSQDPGTWYCGGEGSAFQLDADFMLSQTVLRSVSSLGKCPGKPVEGTMEVCFSGQPCPPGINSTVPGATFNALLDGYDAASGPIGGTEAKFLATIQGAGGHVLLQATSINPNVADVQTSTLGIGTVTIPDGFPDAGAVYCIGDGSTLEYKVQMGAPHALHATLKNLSRLGTCPGTPATGQIGLCMNMHE